MFCFLYIITAWTIFFSLSLSFPSLHLDPLSFRMSCHHYSFFFFSWHHHFRTGTVASPGTSLYSPFFGFRTHLLALSDTTSHSHGNISHLLARPAISTSLHFIQVDTINYLPTHLPTQPTASRSFTYTPHQRLLTYSSSYFLVTLVSKK